MAEYEITMKVSLSHELAVRFNQYKNYDNKNATDETFADIIKDRIEKRLSMITGVIPTDVTVKVIKS